MKIFVEASDHEYLFVVADWLGAEEFFWLFQWAFSHSFYFIGLCIEIEAIADPAIITAENEDFRIIKSERP